MCLGILIHAGILSEFKVYIIIINLLSTNIVISVTKGILRGRPRTVYLLF